jgi:hypothetical protein
MRNPFFVFYLGFFAIVVKDTSSKPPHGLSSLSTVLWSCWSGLIAGAKITDLVALENGL